MRLDLSETLEQRGIIMRWNNVLFVSAILLVAASLPSAAQIRLDMNKITCGNWLGYNQEDREFVRSWMSGYYNANTNNNVLDFDRLQKNTAKITTYCKTHKSDPLPKAINKLAG